MQYVFNDFDHNFDDLKDSFNHYFRKDLRWLSLRKAEEEKSVLILWEEKEEGERRGNDATFLFSIHLL